MTYVRCENHKNEAFWKKYDQKNSSRRNKNMRKKPDRTEKKKKKTTKHGGRSKVEREKRKNYAIDR